MAHATQPIITLPSAAERTARAGFADLDPVTLPPIDVLAVLDATLDDLRASGLTGMVEQLLNTRCAIEDLLAVLQATGLSGPTVRGSHPDVDFAAELVRSGTVPHLRAAFIRCGGDA